MLFPHIKPGACVPLTSALNVPAVPLRHPGFCCPHIRFMKAIHVFNLVLCLLALILPSLSASGTCSADTCNGAVDGDLDAMMVSYLCRATTLNDLADVYLAQGDYAEVAMLYARALTIYEEWLGPKNFIMATKLEDLANLHKTHGNYAEAALLYTRVLAIRKEVLGPEHALTFSTQHNLKLCLLMVMVIIVMVMVMVMLYW
eukprot:TRINITY_DN1138_c1_g2_i4.p1 TRINITY_DN1138_c1_g2~~TRINITY_DN1138_c1_g2_i4.p1  ORF type:complete len:201 (-),score=7.35 TRINITY_DN1138_c1_g2_i4:120-722(-)